MTSHLEIHYISMFYKSSTDWQWKQKCKKLYTARLIKKGKKDKESTLNTIK